MKLTKSLWAYCDDPEWMFAWVYDSYEPNRFHPYNLFSYPARPWHMHLEPTTWSLYFTSSERAPERQPRAATILSRTL